MNAFMVGLQVRLSWFGWLPVKTPTYWCGSVVDGIIVTFGEG